MRPRTSSLLALLALAAGAAPATAAEPIEGDWRTASDEVIRIASVGGGNFEGKVLKVGNVACPGARRPGTVVWRMSGSGSSYTGTLPWYRNCVEFTRTQSTWTLTDNDHGQVRTTPPGGGSMVDHTTIARVPPEPPRARAAGVLPVIVNDVLLDLQGSYARLAGSSRAQRAALFAAMARRTRKGIADLGAYSPRRGESPLKRCAAAAIRRVLSGAVRRASATVASGMHAIADCLRGYASLFPGGRPGATVPHRTHPSARDDQWHGVGTDPNLIPRIDWNYNPLNPVDGIRNLHVVVRVTCPGARVFYLTLTPDHFPFLSPASGRFGTGGGPITSASVGGDNGIVYQMDVYLAGILDSANAAHGTLKAQWKAGSPSPACASSNYKRWYASR